MRIALSTWAHLRPASQSMGKESRESQGTPPTRASMSWEGEFLIIIPIIIAIRADEDNNEWWGTYKHINKGIIRSISISKSIRGIGVWWQGNRPPPTRGASMSWQGEFLVIIPIIIAIQAGIGADEDGGDREPINAHWRKAHWRKLQWRKHTRENYSGEMHTW